MLASPPKPWLDAASIDARKTREPTSILLPLLWLAVANEETSAADDPAPKRKFVLASLFRARRPWPDLCRELPN
jgi:hypothetical protein